MDLIARSKGVRHQWRGMMNTSQLGDLNRWEKAQDNWDSFIQETDYVIIPVLLGCIEVCNKTLWIKSVQ